MKKSEDMEVPEILVGVIIYDHDGKILLFRSHKWGNKYVVCGGKLELGERLEECVKREVKEETSLEIDDIELVVVLESLFSLEFYKKKHMVFLDYCCRKTGGEMNLNDELDSFVWVVPDKALEMDLNFSTREFVKRYIEFKTKG